MGPAATLQRRTAAKDEPPVPCRGGTGCEHAPPAGWRRPRSRRLIETPARVAPAYEQWFSGGGNFQIGSPHQGLRKTASKTSASRRPAEHVTERVLAARSGRPFVLPHKRSKTGKIVHARTGTWRIRRHGQICGGSAFQAAGVGRGGKRIFAEGLDYEFRETMDSRDARSHHVGNKTAPISR
jgi:hypothetical protein